MPTPIREYWKRVKKLAIIFFLIAWLAGVLHILLNHKPPDPTWLSIEAKDFVRKELEEACKDLGNGCSPINIIGKNRWAGSVGLGTQVSPGAVQAFFLERSWQSVEQETSEEKTFCKAPYSAKYRWDENGFLQISIFVSSWEDICRKKIINISFGYIAPRRSA